MTRAPMTPLPVPLQAWPALRPPQRDRAVAARASRPVLRPPAGGVEVGPRHPAVAALHAWQQHQQQGAQAEPVGGLPQQVCWVPPDGRAGAAEPLAAYTWQGGELAAITEADGTHWAYAYGDDGRLLSVARNQAPWARYGYDALGRLQAIDGPSGTQGRTEHRYDDQGRLVHTRLPGGAVRSWRWAGSGSAADPSRVTEALSALEHSQFHHDAQGRLVGLRQVVDGVPLKLALQFDAAGRLAGWQVDEWGQSVALDWDARGRPQALHWNGQTVATLGCDDAQHRSWQIGLGGVLGQAWHQPGSGQVLRQQISHGEACDTALWQREDRRDDALRLVQLGQRQLAYDALGRLVQAVDAAAPQAAADEAADAAADPATTRASRAWHYAHGPDGSVTEAADPPRQLAEDALGRLQMAADARGERVLRHGADGDVESIVDNGQTVARCRYDHKGRLVWLQTLGVDGSQQVERYLYGADDALLAVADGQGRPRRLLLRLPTGLVGLVDFSRDAAGQPISLFCDAQGHGVLASDAQGPLGAPHAFCPWGQPLVDEGVADVQALRADVPWVYSGRLWHPAIGLYRIGARWYCPRLRRFLTPDSHTGAPDDARLVSPFVPAAQQRLARAQVLVDWLGQPLLRQRSAYCCGDPVNRSDPNGHWSFGGVMLALLGVLWTLPNTAFGLAIEITCLIGEVVRWLVYAVTLGHVSWQTPGFDVAASGRLNAFALVFKGGWMGSFEGLLGITFGNVFFVHGEYEQHPAFQALPDTVLPPAYGGTESIPKAQALYEHELRHVVQYSRFGPFFHLGLPLFGVYEWDVILNGYQDAALERDAREHAGF